MGAGALLELSMSAAGKYLGIGFVACGVAPKMETRNEKPQPSA